MHLFFYYSLTKKSKQTEDLDYICNGYIYKADSTAENLSYSPISLEKDNTIYFKKPDSWSDSIFVYMWNSNNNNNNNSNWATTYMKNVSENIYSYTLSSSDLNVTDGFDMIIFSDGTKQTKDLSTLVKEFLLEMILLLSLDLIQANMMVSGFIHIVKYLT